VKELSLTTKEVAKRVRVQLKDEFPGCKFSVRCKFFSMGSEINVSLMVADRKIKQDFDKIPEKTLNHYLYRSHNPYTLEELKRIHSKPYSQLSESKFYHYQRYDDYWCNGAFLTYQGYMLLKRVCQIVEQYHYTDSDPMTDYHDTNFYFHLQLGEYDKPFVDGSRFTNDQQLFNRVEARDRQIKAYFEKEKEEKKLRQIEVDQLRKDNENKTHVPRGATHVIDGSGFRQLTVEEKETGQLRDKLEKKWFNGSVDWKKFTLEL